MGRALSADLRKRVIVAIAGGLSTREAGRRFDIGESTAGAWYRVFQQTGSCAPRKQGQPSGSKLDAHEAFILGLVAQNKDVTLLEIAQQLLAEHGVQTCQHTVWMFFKKRNITYKKRQRTLKSRIAMM